ncbi:MULTISPECIES: long-chain fatty acid--CoA ligase [Actinomadura]|uniref:Fatty-acyl-CoA synthase n=1 Tax=Actinomadura madurae TaxID=1993 RepID=A0A1I5KI68_9ACTN|nr:long-chain fatty acid--CoA ligase [Actinomadura madurae]SFO84764.1 fatty-acyl-CoA synthase [Actinomadura madurae]SPT49993.1 Benzoate--CoA ligase [Actinomadura madurae]
MHGLMQDRSLDVPVLMRRAERMFAHKRVVTATADGETTATWGQVVARARRLTAALDVLGVPRGARVGTFAWNSQRHVELYLGVPSGRRVLHTLNHRLFAAELTYILNDAEDGVLFVDRSLIATVWPLVEKAPAVRHVVLMDDGGTEEVPDDPRIIDYEALLAETPGEAPPIAIDENDAASLCYTSGTTGRPKGVLYSHRSIVLHTLLILGTDNFGIGERDVVMPIVPMFHVNAWGLPYAAALAGADLVLPGPAMNSAALARQMSGHRVTFTAGVPAIWRSLLPLIGQVDVSSLRKVVSGGSPVPDALAREWHEATGVPLSSSWGMTETSPVVASARLATVHDGLDAGARRAILAAPGPSLPLTELRLVGEDGGRVDHDGTTPGELQVAGPTVASRYFGADPGESQFTEDGWLRTGDVATIDRYGYVRIVDRTKDMVKSGGEWISSGALENEIMAHPDVVEAAVIGVPDARWGERPLACVVLAPGRDLDAAGLREHLTGRVASWWIPERIRILAEIPKTGTGKFSKTTLREQFAAHQQEQHADDQ